MGAEQAREEVAPRPIRLPRLTAARALAALSVFCYHAGLAWHLHVWPVTSFGYAGVSFFFVLSGFVLTWSAGERIAPVAFYRRRFARIYPAYATVLVCCAFVAFPDAPAARELPSVAAALLLQAFIAGPGIYAINPPSWSLSVEAAFYAAMPALHRVATRLSSISRAGGIAVLYGCTLALDGWFVHRGGALGYVALANPAARAAEFLLGAGAALECRAGRRLSGRVALVVAAVSVLIALVCNSPAPIAGEELDPAFLVAIALLSQRDLDGRRTSALTGRTMQYLGMISYEFYLVHQLLLSRAHLAGLSAPAGIGLALLGGIVAAALLYEVVQRPSESLLRREPHGPLVRRALLGGLLPVVALFATAVVVATRAPSSGGPAVRDATVSFRIDLRTSTGQAEHLTGVEKVDFADASAHAEARIEVQSASGHHELRELVIGDTRYLRDTTAAKWKGQWSSRSLERGLLPGRPGDPAALAGSLAALGARREIGQEHWGAAVMHRWRVDVDPARLTSAQLSALELVTTPGEVPSRATIWFLLDPSKLVREVQYRIELAVPDRRASETVTGRFELKAFNATVVPVRQAPGAKPLPPGAAPPAGVLWPPLFS